MTRNIIPWILVEFYKFWHGVLQFKGAGVILRRASGIFPTLRNYPLEVPGTGVIPVDFSDVSGFFWINHLLSENCHEQGVIILLQRVAGELPEPLCLWDVGANAGFFAAAILNSVPKVSSLHLFEPNPLLHPMLESIAANHDTVRIHGIGLSDHSGTITFSYPAGNSTLAVGRDGEGGEVFRAEVTTGDDFASRNLSEIPDVIIIDVEGFEYHVLAGLETLISESLPVVIVEHIFAHPVAFDRFFPEGYRRFTIDDATGSLIDGYELTAGHNSVYLPRQLHQSASLLWEGMDAKL